MSLTRLSGSVYAGGQVEGGGESGWQAGGTEGNGDIGVAVRWGRCSAAYSLLLVCFLLPLFFFVAVPVLGSVRLGRCLHEVAVVG